MFDEEIKKTKAYEIGMSLDALSVEELEARINELQTEIVRLKSAIDAKGATRKAADAAFKI